MGVSLTTLRSRVRTRADMVNSTFVSDAEVTQFINDAAQELHELIVQNFGDDYFSPQVHSFTTVAGTEAYNLPTSPAFFKLLGISLQIDGAWRPIRKFAFSAREFYREDTGGRPRYRLEQSTFRLLPAPAGVYSGKLWYVPKLTLLVNGADELEGVHGWEEFVVVSAAIGCVLKEEGDISSLQLAKQEQVQRIQRASARRDPGAPHQVVDVDELGDEDEWLPGGGA